MLKTRTEFISAEANEILNALCTRFIGWKCRVERRVAKELILHGFTFHQGRRCEICSKHVGLGIYEIYLREKTV